MDFVINSRKIQANKTISAIQTYLLYNSLDEKTTIQVSIPGTNLVHVIPDALVKSLARDYALQTQIELSGDQTDPINCENWADLPEKEFLLPGNGFSKCYSISSILQTFVFQLSAERGGNHFPQWPYDPFSRSRLSPEQIRAFVRTARARGFDIPPLLNKFIKVLDTGLIDTSLAMSDPFIGNTDHIRPEYSTGVVQPLTEALFGKQKLRDTFASDRELARRLQASWR